MSASAAVLLAVSPMQPLKADQYQRQIDDLKSEVNKDAAVAEDLRVEGDTLQQAVNNLKSKIRGLQAKISKNQAKQTELRQQITQAVADIEERNAALSDNLRMMYLEGEVSSLEKVASSRSISDYVDKQEARNRIQNRIKTAMDEIKQLKQQLEEQKKKVEQLIRDDQAMEAEVDKQRAKQARLLAQTRGKESAYQKQIKQNKAKISDLQVQQAAAIAAAAAQSGSQWINTGGTGSYPWSGSGFPCTGADPWGMCFRQCVSYTAWKVASTGRHMPYWGGVGNANQWPGNAEAAGIPTGSEPRKGAVAVMMVGQYGHTMYVEDVLSGGSQIRISEYNYAWDGRYSERVQSSAGLIYIYF